MAKKETEEKQSDNKHWILVTGLVICGLSVFLLIAFISFCFTWKTVYSADSSIYGFFGKFGYNTAKAFVNAFGFGALVFPLISFTIGIQILRPSKTFVKLLFALLGGMILLAVIPTFIFFPVKKANTWLQSGIGGTAGKAAVAKMLGLAGGLGTGLFLLTIFIVYCLFLTHKTIDVLKTIYHKTISFLRHAPALIMGVFKEREQTTEPKPKNPKTNKPIEIHDSPIVNADDGFVIIRNTDDDEPEDEDSSPKIPSYNLQPEFKTEEIEEVYLPEHMLAGELYDPTRDLSGYCRPPIDLLEDYKSSAEKTDTEELNRNKDKIVQILGNYKIGIDKIFATVGPTVTLYEVVPKDGVRIAQIKRLEDDIALRIAALGVRIIAPIPGKGTVGIEVPNEKPDIVSMRSIIKSAKFQESKFELPIALGKTILGEVFAFDLAKMPHLLIAGATGQGKSVGLNAILTSLLYKKHPAELKLVMVDPKKVELTPYSKIEKHFLAKLPDTEEPIITDTQKVVYTLKSMCIEMDSRYDLLKLAGVRNLKEYNEKFVNRRLNPEKGHRYMPYIVLVIDEFADLIMTAGREIEEPIARLAQLARAIGIHLVIATQRPTTNIITGLIKANFPARIAFRVTSMIDSRTILDTPGANQLIGRGDMLVSTGSDLIRVQCAFVDTPEVDRVTDYIRTQPGYAAAYDLPEYVGEEKDGPKQIDMKNLDPMFEEAAKLIVQAQQGSTSLIQRKMSLGYNRAGRIMDQLEASGIVGPADGSKPRQVLITDFMTLDSIIALYK